MNISYEEKKRIFKAIASTSLSMIFAYLVKEYTYLLINLITLMIITMGSNLFVWLFSHVKLNFYIYLSLVLVQAYILYTFFKKSILIWNNNIGGMDHIYQGVFYKEIHTTILCLFAVFWCCVLINLFMKTYYTRIITMLLIITGLIILQIFGIQINKFPLFILLNFIIWVLIEMFLNKKKIGTKKYKKQILMSLMPVCFICSLIVIIIPASDKPLTWGIFKNLANSVGNTFDSISNGFSNIKKINGEFGLNFIGYSEDDNILGGSLSKSDKIVLELKSSSNQIIYLNGSIKEIYTGKKWEKGLERYYGEYDETYMDYIELIYSLEREMHLTGMDLNTKLSSSYLNTKDDRNPILKKMGLQIEFKNIRTKSVFYPIKTYKYDFIKSYELENANVLFTETKGKNTKYFLNYFNFSFAGLKALTEMNEGFNYNEQAVLLNQEQQYQYSYLLFNERMYDYRLSTNNLPVKLAERSRDIQTNCTSLPIDLPERVYELAKEITKDASSDYEKAMAVENYFEDWEYTLKPEPCPKEEDFVDNFLFEQRKGYCTYYATSMAVLLRCVGIPTRYVEGFRANCTSGITEVNSNQAHAWTEVYFEGVGWIPFEPTPGMQIERYDKFNEEIVKEMETTVSNSESTSDKNKTTQPSETMTQTVAVSIQNEEISPINNIIYVVAVILSVLFIILITVYFVYKYKKYKNRKLYLKSNNSDKVKILFESILKLYSKEGQKREDSDTILDFCSSLHKNKVFNRIEFSQIAEIYMKARYSQLDITKEELRTVGAFMRGFNFYIKNKNQLISKL